MVTNGAAGLNYGLGSGDEEDLITFDNTGLEFIADAGLEFVDSPWPDKVKVKEVEMITESIQALPTYVTASGVGYVLQCPEVVYGNREVDYNTETAMCQYAVNDATQALADAKNYLKQTLFQQQIQKDKAASAGLSLKQSLNLKRMHGDESDENDESDDEHYGCGCPKLHLGQDIQCPVHLRIFEGFTNNAASMPDGENSSMTYSKVVPNAPVRVCPGVQASDAHSDS